MYTVNGVDNGQGYRLPTACTLVGVTAQFEVTSTPGAGRTATFAVFKNDVDTSQSLAVGSLSAAGEYGGSATGLSYSLAADDTVTVKAKVDNVDCAVTKIAILLHVQV